MYLCLCFRLILLVLLNWILVKRPITATPPPWLLVLELVFYLTASVQICSRCMSGIHMWFEQDLVLSQAFCVINITNCLDVNGSDLISCLRRSGLNVLARSNISMTNDPPATNIRSNKILNIQGLKYFCMSRASQSLNSSANYLYSSYAISRTQGPHHRSMTQHPPTTWANPAWRWV